MLSHVASPLASFPSSDWYNITLDDSFPSVSCSGDSFTSSSASSSCCCSSSPCRCGLSPSRGLAQRRPRHKLVSGDSLAPLTPHLYPRTPFCSPNSSPLPLDDFSPLSSPLSATVGSSHTVFTASSLLTPSRKKASHSSYHAPHHVQSTTAGPASPLTVYTAHWVPSSSSGASPHSARSHSVPFLPFRYFEDAECELSPDSAVSLPQYCTPFPSPNQPPLRQSGDPAPPSPLLLTLPSSPQLSPSSTSSPLVDCSSSLHIPPSLLSNQPPLSPAVVPLTPPSSPLPAALLPPASFLHSAHRMLNIPPLC